MWKDAFRRVEAAYTRKRMLVHISSNLCKSGPRETNSIWFAWIAFNGKSHNPLRRVRKQVAFLDAKRERGRKRGDLDGEPRGQGDRGRNEDARGTVEASRRRRQQEQRRKREHAVSFSVAEERTKHLWCQREQLYDAADDSWGRRIHFRRDREQLGWFDNK